MNEELNHNENAPESSDYQHGYNSGLEQVEKDTYESYLSSKISWNWLTDRLAQKEKEVGLLEQTIVDSKQTYKQAYDRLQNHILQLTLASKEKERLETERQNKQATLEALDTKRQKTTNHYSLMAGILYLIAGVSFVAGDLIISHEIVAYALNIRNNFEAWAFAIGLAMLSVLLKPAYERLIEQPYLDNGSVQSQRVYAWFKGGLVAFSVVTLFILGYFRYEAYKTDKLKESVNKTIKNMQMQMGDTNLDPSATPNTAAQSSIMQQIELQLQKIDTLNQALVTSTWALASFVLSGILFALAGAVCLGIAFPVLSCYWQRWLQIDPHRKRLQKQIKEVASQLKMAEERVAQEIVQKNIEEKSLELIDDLAMLQAKKKQLLHEIEIILDKLRLHKIEYHIHSYNDGYAKGERVLNELSAEELKQFKEQYFTLENLAHKAKSNGSDKVATFGTNKENNTLRPHQAIRKMIADKFNEE